MAVAESECPNNKGDKSWKIADSSMFLTENIFSKSKPKPARFCFYIFAKYTMKM